MVTEYVNIPRSVNDSHYRYKMPKSEIKSEGRGNGKKTVIVNIVEIAKALNVPPSYVTKYFGNSIGTQTKLDEVNGRAIINGENTDVIDDILDEFIKKYVLCSKCNLPETTIKISKNNILLPCSACGNVHTVDPQERLNAFIFKNPPPKTKKMDEKKRIAQSNEKDKKKDMFSGSEFLDDGKEVEWITDISEEAVQKRLNEEQLSEMIQKMTLSTLNDSDDEVDISPVEILKEYVSQRPNCTEQQLLRMCLKIKKEYSLKDRDVAAVFFESLLDNKLIIPTLKKRARLFSRFIKTATTQRLILSYIEELVGIKETELLKYTSVILETLFDNHIIDDDVLLGWSKKKKGKFVTDKIIIAKIRAASRPFIMWLKSKKK